MAQEIHECFFCNEKAEGKKDIMRGFFYVECSLCGYYWLHDKVIRKHFNNDSEKKAGPQARVNCACHNILSAKNAIEDYVPIWLSSHESIKHLKQGLKDSPSQFNDGSVGVVFSDIAFETVNHANKASDLLTIASKQLEDSEPFGSFQFRAEDRVRSKIGTKNELKRIVKHLQDKGHIELLGDQQNDPYDNHYHITIEGWDTVKNTNVANHSKRAFIAMQFNWGEDDKQRKDAYNAIVRACDACGYTADVVSQNHTENITNKIMTEINESRFVIAEMTCNNRGVYFESGYARGRGIPVFHVIKHDHVDGENIHGKRIHFDIQQIMYKKWTNVAELEEELKNWIKATIGNYDDQ